GRRRHTRFSRDWSSDVCSSDLGHVDVQQDHVRLELGDGLDRRVDVLGLAHDLDRVAQLGPHPRPEEPVVVDDQHPRHCFSTFIVSITSVPSPGSVRTRAEPPCRSILPMMDSLMPIRSAGTASRSNPLPRSFTKIVTSSPSTSAYTEMVGLSEYLAALTIACRAALSMAPSRPPESRSMSPTQTTSICTPCASSSSAAIRRTAAARVASASWAGW